MKILFEDAHIAVCFKNAGELSEGDGPNCIPRLIEEHLASKGVPSPTVFPVHRLDRETAGLMVYALHSAAAASLSADIQRGGFEKVYLALCHGRPESDADTLRDLIFYDRHRGKSFVVKRSRAGVKEALLQYRVLKSNNETSLLEVSLITGRTHQIRVQFASRMHPLVADRRYGAPKSERQDLCLLSYKLSFLHPVTRKPTVFTADLPDWYECL